jgi:hypothetical protein
LQYEGNRTKKKGKKGITFIFECFFFISFFLFARKERKRASIWFCQRFAHTAPIFGPLNQLHPTPSVSESIERTIACPLF